jgi:hypothetical protein
VRNLESFIPVIDDYVLHTSKYPSFIISWWSYIIILSREMTMSFNPNDQLVDNVH